MATTRRFPWVAVSAVVAAGLIATTAWLRIPESEGRPGAVVELPSLGLTQIGPTLSNELLAEQLAAYDPTPLFLPTSVNSNEPPLPDEARSGIGGPFTALPPELTKMGPLKFPSPVPVPKNPVDGLRLTERTDAPLALGLSDTVGGALKERLCQVEAVVVGSGKVALTLDLPRSGRLPEGDWQPLELIGAVTRVGLAGELVVTTSSGSDEIDDYFRSHLKENVCIGQRLPQGFYAFRVGP